jgi:phosphoenolpyruvate synthase/pyruvate phosphate dikinase
VEVITTTLYTPLDNAWEVNQFGGKAANLSFLISKGFPVPQGIAFSADLDAKDLNEYEELINSKIPYNRVSVSSSMVLEDGNTTSFAGIFSSFLNLWQKNYADKNLIFVHHTSMLQRLCYLMMHLLKELMHYGLNLEGF